MENNKVAENDQGESDLINHSSSKEAPQSCQKITAFDDLLENSLNDWWKNLRKFVEIYLWGAYYSLIPLFLGLLFTFISTTIDLPLVKLILTIFLVAVLMVIIYFFIQSYAGMFIFVKKRFQGTAKEAFIEARPFIWSYLWLSLLTGILLLLWTLLLIIPGIIFSIYYSLAVYVFFFEDKKGMAAIKRSAQLVKGYWWPVAGRVLIFSLLLWILMMIISIPGMLVDKNSWFSYVWSLITQLISYIIGPIALIFSYKIYQDLVNIKK